LLNWYLTDSHMCLMAQIKLASNQNAPFKLFFFCQHLTALQHLKTQIKPFQSCQITVSGP
jgi:hypothetical protein